MSPWRRRPVADGVRGAPPRAEAEAAGFKLSLEEFDLALDDPARRRAAAVTKAGSLLARELWLQQPRWMLPAAPGTAASGWRGEGPWAAAEIAFRSRAVAYDAAVAALLAPEPLRCETILDEIGHLAPHLPQLKQLAHDLTLRLALDLLAGRREEAWTNLLAVNTLAARYEPEPFDISVITSSGLANVAYVATWEALRTNVWSEAQLATLAALWEPERLGRHAEATPAIKAAQLLGMASRARQEGRTNRLSLAEITPSLSTLLNDPLTYGQETWKRLRRHRLNRLWVRRDSYLDEAIIIGSLRVRQAEIRNATAQPSWAAMQEFPGATRRDPLTLTNNFTSKLQAMINLQMLRQGMVLYAADLEPNIIGLFARHEIRRRVLLAALEVERFRLRHGRLPASLDELPGLLPDFADGAPLRYRPAPDGTFVLHSIGLDLQDDGGLMWGNAPRRGPGPRPLDIVWPREATAGEAAAARDVPPFIMDPNFGGRLQLAPPENAIGIKLVLE
ncbi:MAG: hypothetical protein ACKVYV_15930 [Limisphaerales bacterium]